MDASKDVSPYNAEPDHLATLGPFARALFLIFYGAEGNREDKRKIGLLEHKPSIKRFSKLGFFNSSFIVFKATYMESEWIFDWKLSFGATGLKNPSNGKVDLLRKDMPAYINLPTCISAYESFKTALNFVQTDITD